MKTKDKKDRRWLLATAKAVSEKLKLRGEGTRIRVYPSGTISTWKTDTGGWEVVVGRLGKPRLTPDPELRAESSDGGNGVSPNGSG